MLNRATRRLWLRSHRPGTLEHAGRISGVVAATITSSLALLVAGASPAGASPAGASPAGGSAAGTSSTGAALQAARARAAHIEAQIQRSGRHLEIVSQQVDGARQQVAQLDVAVALEAAQVRAEQGSVAAAHLRLRHAALQAYMDGGTTSNALNQVLGASADAAMTSSEYTSVATHNLSKALAQVRHSEQALSRAERRLRASRTHAASALATVTADEQAAAAAQHHQQAVLAKVQGQVASLIRQQQIEQQIAQAMIFQAEQAAARKAAQAAAQAAARSALQAALRRAAGGAGAASHATAAVGAGAFTTTAGGAATSNSNSGTSSLATNGNIPVASGALGAIAAAESQLGVPYVWGGESPGNGFDCSGLTQWAWGLAGVALPRTAQQQYNALPHIPLSALQPGDLLFWNDGTASVQHVAMYIGGGEVVQAPYTGASVSLSTIWTNGLVGAARP